MITVATIIEKYAIENSICLKIKVIRNFLIKESLFLKTKDTLEYIPVSINTVTPHTDYSDYDALLKDDIGVIDLKENHIALDNFENCIYINVQAPIEDRPVREDFDTATGHLYLPPVINIKNSTTKNDFLKYIPKENMYIFYNRNACYCQLKPIVHSFGKLHLSFLFKETIDYIEIEKYLDDYNENWKKWDTTKIRKELESPICWLKSCIKSYSSKFIVSEIEKNTVKSYEFTFGTILTKISYEYGYSYIKITYKESFNLKFKEKLGELEFQNMFKVNKNTTVNEFLKKACSKNIYSSYITNTYAHFKLPPIRYNLHDLSISFEFNFNKLNSIFISINGKENDINDSIKNLIFINTWLLETLSLNSPLKEGETVTDDTIFTYNLSFGTILSQLDENNIATVEIKYFYSTLDIDRKTSFYSIFK